MLDLSKLNPEQKEAVNYLDGPALIVAGPGSGKTRCLTYRAANLVDQGVSPENLLLVTFTNKSANEMKERVIKLLHQRQSLPHVGTFHSICARILRKHIQHLGFPQNYLIYDETDQRAIVRQAMAELKISTQKFNPNAVLATISSAKNRLVSPREYASFARGYFQEIVAKVYPQYQKLLRKNQALDFDDLQNFTLTLFEENPTILEFYQNLFQHILVDEYQDTNQVQYLLSKNLANKHRQIAVVGDCSQSIYSFRGADLRNVLQFQEDFPEAKIFNLEQNYRSTQNILDAATAIISLNQDSHPVLKLWTQKPQGAPITIYEAADGKNEAEKVIEEIKKHLGKKDWQDFAVLYRTHAQSRILEETCLHEGIPYRLVGGTRFYQRREIKDILSFLKLIKNPTDSISFKRIVNVPPRGIGPVTLKRGGEVLDKFNQLMKEFRTEAQKLNTVELIEFLVKKVNYKDYIDDGTEEGMMRWENVLELKSVAQEFRHLNPEESLEAFLESVALMDYSNDLAQDPVKKSHAVTLMTLHAAKGLEFPVVFMVGMEEGLFPHSRSLLEKFDLEEERRLCYVGITRAKEKAFLSYARSRLYFGSPTVNLPSRFLQDIPEHLLKREFSPYTSFSSYNFDPLLDKEY